MVLRVVILRPKLERSSGNIEGEELERYFKVNSQDNSINSRSEGQVEECSQIFQLRL